MKSRVDSVAVITGGTSGIGWKTSELLLENRPDAACALVDLNEGRSGELIERFGRHRVSFVQSDVTDPAAADTAVAEIESGNRRTDQGAGRGVGAGRDQGQPGSPRNGGDPYVAANRRPGNSGPRCRHCGTSPGTPGTTGDLAAAIVFLLSEQASFITGELVHVDGGFRAQRLA